MQAVEIDRDIGPGIVDGHVFGRGLQVLNLRGTIMNARPFERRRRRIDTDDILAEWRNQLRQPTLAATDIQDPRSAQWQAFGHNRFARSPGDMFNLGFYHVLVPGQPAIATG